MCYILRAIRAGSCRERRYADHIIIYSDILQNAPFLSQFFKFFFASGGKGGLTPLTKILRTFLRVCTCVCVCVCARARARTCANSASGEYLACLKTALSTLCPSESVAWQLRLTSDMFLAAGFDRRCQPLVHPTTLDDD